MTHQVDQKSWYFHSPVQRSVQCACEVWDLSFRISVQAALDKFDSNQDKRLDRDEFVEFSRELVKNGPDMFFMRVGRDAAINTTLLPVATRSLQGAASASGWKAVADVPLHIAAPAVGAVFRAVKALLPVGL
jgi:hypothetical protein